MWYRYFNVDKIFLFDLMVLNFRFYDFLVFKTAILLEFFELVFKLDDFLEDKRVDLNFLRIVDLFLVNLTNVFMEKRDKISNHLKLSNSTVFILEQGIKCRNYCFIVFDFPILEILQKMIIRFFTDINRCIFLSFGWLDFHEK